MNAPTPSGELQRLPELLSILATHAEGADGLASVHAEVWTGLRSTGIAMAPFPKELQGQGLCKPQNFQNLFETLRLIGAADLSIGRIYEGHVNAVALLARYGEPSQLAALAARVSAGAFCGVWGAENAQGLRAVKSEQGVLLHGCKILASGSGTVTHPLVSASTDDGQILCLLSLPPDYTADLSGWTAQGMRSSATGTVDLSDTFVPFENIVGVPGDFTRQPYFSGGAWRFCAVQLGAIERLVDLFCDYLKSRGRDSDPFQLQRVAQAVAAASTARFWIEEAARRFSEQGGRAVAYANLTRMVTERAALDVMEIVHRGVGLNSFLRPNPIERISRDLATYLRQPVPDLAMMDAGRTFVAASLPVGNF